MPAAGSPAGGIVPPVHPIERLRHIARAGDVDQTLLVRESAAALASLGLDSGGMLMACRRLLARHPVSGGLWSLAARVVCSTDPEEAAWEFAEQVAADTTYRTLTGELPEGGTVLLLGGCEAAVPALVRRGDVEVLVVEAVADTGYTIDRLGDAGLKVSDVPLTGLAQAASVAEVALCEAVAAGPDGAVVEAGGDLAAIVARGLSLPVWLVAPLGRVLPPGLWRRVSTSLMGPEPWFSDRVVVPMTSFDLVLGPGTDIPAGGPLERADCPEAPELTRTGF